MQRVLEALNALRMNDPDRLGDWFGRFITLYRSAGHAMPADESRSRIEIEWDLQQGHVLHRHPWTRMAWRSEEHTSELQSLMRISNAVFCLKKKTHHISLLHT